MRHFAMVLLGLLSVLVGLAGANAAPGDVVADRVFGQPDFTHEEANNGGGGASNLYNPLGAAVDGVGNLYVADYNNNRVLEYDSPSTTDTVADRVFGQGGSFNTRTCNLGGISAASLCQPVGAAVGAGGNLYVADHDNNRVLEYDSPSTTDTVADRVFGQDGSFNTHTCNLGVGISATSLCVPNSVAMDGAGNLYVADSGNNRVLEYDSPSTTDTVADRVFGQDGSFNTAVCHEGGIGANTLCNPRGVALDSVGNLYVADSANHRILEYDSPLTTDTVSDRVFGQGGSFNTADCNRGGISANSLCDLRGVALDSVGNLYVADFWNNRVLEYHNPLATDTVADRVFGQGGSFSSGSVNLGGISAASLYYPAALTLDSAGRLYVADNGNNRVLEYDSPLNGPVGGTAELPELAQSHSSAATHYAPAIGLVAAVLALAASVRYARRRWRT
jgi:sugar lactone lactonase YvrE